MSKPRGKVAGSARGVYKAVVSVDVPSGIDSKTGEVMGECAQADLTVALGFQKLRAGKTMVKDISIPRQLLKNKNVKARLQ